MSTTQAIWSDWLPVWSPVCMTTNPRSQSEAQPLESFANIVELVGPIALYLIIQKYSVHIALQKCRRSWNEQEG